MAAAKSRKNLIAARLRPYLAPVLLEATGRAVNQRLLDEIVREAETIVSRSSDRIVRKLVESTSMGATAGLRLHALVYSESRAPAWYIGQEHDNVTHELVVVAARGGNALICASDGAARDRIVKNLTSAKPLPPAALSGFVGTEAAAIWLNGVHTPTAVKANTKFLTGVSLEYALDPLGDQTYRCSAIRSHPDIPGLKDDRARSLMVGAAPDGARVWIGRPADWQVFAGQLGAILDHALARKPAADVYGFLAQPIDDTSVVKDPYAIAIVPGELLSEDAIDEQRREEARRWAYDARFEIVGKDGLSLEIDPYLNGVRLGRVRLGVTFDHAIARLSARWTDEPSGAEKERSDCDAMLTDCGKVKIYYDSGHTVMQSRCYTAGFTDQPFGWTFESMKGFDIDREKPDFSKSNPLAKVIGLKTDTSLFGFVTRKLFPKGWLACDDGSMELADFIHVDTDKAVVTLVHVKASQTKKPDRTVSVADYEIVVSQAVKNVRHLDRRNLETELRNGRAKKIGAAVWKDGKRQANRDGFLAAVKALPPTATKVAMVLQPRLTSTELAACANPNASKVRRMRMKQLNALMLSARLSTMACGAELRAVAEQL
jgi:hypothetical protein